MIRAAFLAAALFAGPGFANGYTAGDLGLIEDRADCMERADAALRAYAGELGFEPAIVVSSWIVTGYRFEPGRMDVAMMCPDYREDDAEVMNGYVVVHESFDALTEDDRQLRVPAIKRLIALFREPQI